MAYGNFFINNSGGIRVKEGANHYIYNNYFSTGSLSAVELQYVAEYPLDNINFVHNTFIDCTVDLGTSGLTNITFANNIFTKSSGSIFRNSVGNEKWLGNIYKGFLGISIPTGMTNSDPKLALNSDGYYGLTAASPAINAASANYPAILDIANTDDDPTLLFDIKGLPRPASAMLKDVGCEEYNAFGTTVNRPLKLVDVGPTYLKPLTTTNNPFADALELKIIKRKDTSLLNVNYFLPSDTQVSFEIFNLNGQLVKSYLNNQKESVGAHSKNFDLKILESGIYIARLSANTTSKTQKIIIENNY